MSSTSASLENANKNNANNNNNNFTTSSSSIGQIINFKDFQPPPLSLLHKPPNSDNSNNNNNNSTDQQQQELELSDDLKKLFNVKVNLLGLAVPPALCKSALHNLNDYVLKFRKIKCVVTEPLLENKKIILLGLYGNPVGNDEMLIENQTQLISVLPPPVKTFIEENTTADAAADTTTTTIDSSSSTSTSENSKTNNNNNNSITLISYPIQITYENWTSEEILKSLLPVEAPSGFELIGHIAHFNLKDQHLPYKKIIGQVILDKFRTIKTVVNKTQNIDNTFRFFQMELLAGENNFNVTVKESNCIFNFDFSRVYFNSRLQYEHNRLVESFPESDVICDVMAGVGPFAVPLAKNGCFVYANDLNPHAFECLVNNSAKNHVSNKLKAFNLDGRVFLKDLAKSIFVSHQPGFISASNNNNNNTNNNKKANNNNNHHHSKNKNSKAAAEKFPTVLPAFTQVVMNLPAIAIEFLDAFRGIFNFDNETEIEGIPITVTSKQVFTKMPTIHVYMFSRAEDLVQDGKEKACHYLGYPIDKSTIKVHDVRDVAPNKHMLCVSFPLPAEVAFGTYPTTDSTTTFATSTDTTSSSSTDDSVSLAQKRTREETEAEHSTNDQEGNSNDTVKRVRSDDDN